MDYGTSSGKLLLPQVYVLSLPLVTLVLHHIYGISPCKVPCAQSQIPGDLGLCTGQTGYCGYNFSGTSHPMQINYHDNV